MNEQIVICEECEEKTRISCDTEKCPNNQEGLCNIPNPKIITYSIQWDEIKIPVCKTGLELMGIEVKTMENRLDFSMRAYYGRQI